jgi:hypothetical protein
MGKADKERIEVLEGEVKDLRSEVETLRAMPGESGKRLLRAIKELEFVPETPQPEPRYCGHTAAEWQRVIDEKFDVQARDGDDPSWEYHRYGQLKKFVFNHEAGPFGLEWGYFYTQCRIRREPGHRQPHFGGGECPENAKEKMVLVRRNDKTTFYHHNADWLVWDNVVEYIVLS